MKPTPEQLDRRERCLAFLRKLPRKRFNFNVIVLHGTACGTVGCAIGWAPAYAPEVAEWDKDTCGEVKVAGVDPDDEWWNKIPAALFGLEPRFAENLFCPDERNQFPLSYKIPHANCNSTPKQVAKRLAAGFKYHDERLV